MNDFDSDDAPPDVTRFEPALTLETLLAPCPESFVIAGRDFTCTSEDVYYADEYMPVGYSVTDENWDFSQSYEPVDREAPPLVDVVIDVLCELGGPQLGMPELEGLPGETQDLIIRAKLTLCNQQLVQQQTEVEWRAEQVKAWQKKLDALTPNDLTRSVTSILTGN